MMPPPLSSTAASQCTAALQGGFSRALFCLLFLSLLASFLPLSPSPSLSFCLCLFVSLSVCVRVWSVVVCGLVVRSAHRVRRESAKRKAPWQAQIWIPDIPLWRSKRGIPPTTSV